MVQASPRKGSGLNFSNSQTYRFSAHWVGWNAGMTLRLIRSTNWRNHSLLSLKKLEWTTSRRSLPRNGRKHHRLRPLAFLFTGTWVTQMARRRHSLWQSFTALRLRHQQWIGYQQPCNLSRLSLQSPWAPAHHLRVQMLLLNICFTSYAFQKLHCTDFFLIYFEMTFHFNTVFIA